MRSIESNGYDPKYPIFVDLNRQCFNGTHRLAFCAWFGITEVPALVVPRRLKMKTVKEVKQYYGLSEEEFELVELAYERMRERLLGFDERCSPDT